MGMQSSASQLRGYNFSQWDAQMTCITKNNDGIYIKYASNI